jgi:EmrB/QacA subfamily drug resistance transporter
MFTSAAGACCPDGCPVRVPRVTAPAIPGEPDLQVAGPARAAVPPAAAPGAQTAPPAPPARSKALVLAVCCGALFMVGLDNTIVTVGLPSIGRSLHAPLSGLQWTSAGYTVMLASLLLFSGALADRIGRRTVFQIGLALFTLGSWLCSLAPSLTLLVVFRLVQGVGGSMLTPSALGILTNTFVRPAERARAIGIWDGVLGVSMALGPLAGGILVASAGWRGIFWANIPVGLTAICLTALFAPESRAASVRRPDPVGQVLVIVLLGSLSYAIIQAPSYGWLSAPIFGCWMCAEVALTLLLYWEKRRDDPLLDFGFFRSAPFAGAILAALAGMAAMSGFLFLSTLYLQDVRGYSALGAGVALLPMPAAMAVCAPLAGRIVAGSGPRVPLAVAGAALTLSCAALSLIPASPSTLYLAAAYALFGVGVGMVNPAITYGVMSGVPKSQASVASGMNSSSRQFGQALGTAVIGSLLASQLSGGMRAGFLPAAHAAWWVLTGCGYLVLLIGFASTSPRAGRGAVRAGETRAAAAPDA